MFHTGLERKPVDEIGRAYTHGYPRKQSITAVYGSHPRWLCPTLVRPEQARPATHLLPSVGRDQRQRLADRVRGSGCPRVEGGIANSRRRNGPPITVCHFLLGPASGTRASLDCSRSSAQLAWSTAGRSRSGSPLTANTRPRHHIPAQWDTNLAARVLSGAKLHNRGNEAIAAVTGAPGSFATSRSSTDYAARGAPGDPRGRKSGAGPGVANPRWPARAEGEKRFRSATRNP
jgi:hypothetical protein